MFPRNFGRLTSLFSYIHIQDNPLVIAVDSSTNYMEANR